MTIEQCYWQTIAGKVTGQILWSDVKRYRSVKQRA